jgi:beta-lactamase class A
MEIHQKLILYAQQHQLKYALFAKTEDQAALWQANTDLFSSASIIKIPILFAWVMLERQGLVNRHTLCDLDSEPQVQGAGFSWLLHARQIPYQDVLLMMIALSDNLCTNLILKEIGLERLAKVFEQDLKLRKTKVQRKLMDYAAKARGLDNIISAEECVRFYQIRERLSTAERDWVDSMLAANQDDALLKRNIPRDTLVFYHKSGSMEGVLHDWGYTQKTKVFLLTENVQDEPALFDIFGKVGEIYLK